jgi:hypothetical protein
MVAKTAQTDLSYLETAGACPTAAANSSCSINGAWNETHHQ